MAQRLGSEEEREMEALFEAGASVWRSRRVWGAM